MSGASIRRLAEIAARPERLVIGLMSGTSLDGLDIALCRIAGTGFDTELTVEAFETAPFDDAFRTRISEVFARRDADLQEVTLLNVLVAETHARLVTDALRQWSIPAAKVDLVASHGQTIYHAPRSFHGGASDPDATLQIGDGDHLSVRTGIVTCSDFRQKHIAAGGEGAPLVAYGDILLFTDEVQDRVLLNIGGIANLTFLPARKSEGEAFASDLGPGNTLMDAYVRRHCAPLAFDEDAGVARRGTVHGALLERLLRDSFLALPVPKTTGPEHFSLARFEALRQEIAPGLSHEDAMATLNRFSAEAMAAAIRRLPGTPDIYMSGGGARNPLLTEHLRALLPAHILGETSALGVDPDAKEAVLFALLANELVAGDPKLFAGRIRGGPAVSMGKISLPD